MPKNIYNQGFVKNLLEVMVPPSSREVSGFTEARTSHHLPPSLTFSHLVSGERIHRGAHLLGGDANLP